MLTPITSSGLEPEPIPLDIKLIIIGNPRFYYLLYQMDEEFRELYARFLQSRCEQEGWRWFEISGIARMVEYASELVGDQTRLSTRFADIRTLMPPERGPGRSTSCPSSAWATTPSAAPPASPPGLRGQ